MKRDAITRLRHAAGMTQEELAERAGIKRSYLGHVESGIRNPTLDKAMKISEALGRTIEEVFQDEIFFGQKCYKSERAGQKEAS